MKSSEDRFRVMVDTIPALVWCTLPDGSNEFHSQRWHEYTGLPEGAETGWGCKVAYHPEDLERLLNEFQSIVASGAPGEMEARLRRFDREYRWFLIRAAPLRDETGKIVKWYGSSTDIEDRKRAEEKLRQEERELRRITDAIPQTIVVQDPEDIERLRAERQAALSRGVPFEIEQRALRRDGQYRWFLIRYNPFNDEQGLLVRWYATGTDIDDRKRAEERTRNENVALREEIDRSSMFEEIVGSASVLRQVLAQVAKVAPTDSTVLISGETGTGKELIARAVHKRSNRSARAFIRVNCAAISPSL